MVIHAFELLSRPDVGRLKYILEQRNNSELEVKEAIGLLEKCGSIEYAAKTARKLVSDSWNGLEPRLKKSAAKELLREFADYLIEREI